MYTKLTPIQCPVCERVNRIEIIFAIELIATVFQTDLTAVLSSSWALQVNYSIDRVVC